jgi:hypothetical protein
MKTNLRAANLGPGAVVRRNGLKCVKGDQSEEPWVMRRHGRFDDSTVDQWITEGAVIEQCCSKWGIGDHDSVEHEPHRLTTHLIEYVSAQPRGVYVHDAAANVLGCGSYDDLRRVLGNLTAAGVLTHESTGREGVWADLWRIDGRGVGGHGAEHGGR